MFQTKQGLGKVPKPLTYLLCLSCKTENSRPFKEGDYIFKEVEEKCPKCGSNHMIITGIYVKDEEVKKGKSRIV